MTYIKLFREVSEDEIRKVGIKALSIARLIQNGFNTPPGFIITSDAFTDFIFPVKSKLTEILSGIHEIGIEEISNEIQKIVSGLEFPEKMRQEVLEAYLSLGFDSKKNDASSLLSTREEYVAVRSRGSLS